MSTAVIISKSGTGTELPVPYLRRALKPDDLLEPGFEPAAGHIGSFPSIWTQEKFGITQDKVADFDYGRMIAGTRVYSPQFLRELTSRFASQSDMFAGMQPEGRLARMPAKFSNLSVAHQLAWEHLCTEAIDLVRQNGRVFLRSFRAIGQSFREHGFQPTTPSEVQDVGVKLPDNQHRVKIDPHIIRMIGDELVHLTTLLPDIQKLIPHQAAWLTSANELHGLKNHNPANQATILTYMLASVIGSLSDAQYQRLHEGTPETPTGLEPFFRIYSAKDIEQYATFSLKAWALRKTLEPEGVQHPSYQHFIDNGSLPLHERAFLPALALGEMRWMRLREREIFDHGLEVGKKLVEGGIMPASLKQQTGQYPSLTLANGNRVDHNRYALVLAAYDQHANWYWTGEASYLSPVPELRLAGRKERPEHVQWDPHQLVDEKYIPDFYGIFARWYCLAEYQRNPGSPGDDLVKKLQRAATPQKDGIFSESAVEELTKKISGIVTVFSAVAPHQFGELTKGRATEAFAALRDREPGTLHSPVARDWSELSPSRKLFERSVAVAFFKIASHLPDVTQREILDIGSKVLFGGVDQERFAKMSPYRDPLIGVPLQFNLFEIAQLRPELLSNLARSHGAAHDAANFAAWQLAQALSIVNDNNTLANAPKPRSESDLVVHQGRMRARVYENITFLAARFAELGPLLEASTRGNPGIQTTKPLLEALPLDLIQKLTRDCTMASKAPIDFITNRGLARLRFNSLPANEQVQALIRGPELVDLLRLTGRTCLKCMRVWGTELLNSTPQLFEENQALKISRTVTPYEAPGYRLSKFPAGLSRFANAEAQLDKITKVCDEWRQSIARDLNRPAIADKLPQPEQVWDLGTPHNWLFQDSAGELFNCSLAIAALSDQEFALLLKSSYEDGTPMPKNMFR